MKPIEQVDLEQLKDVCKSLNEHPQISEKIQVLDVSEDQKKDLIDKFSKGVESLTVEQQDELPDNVAFFYNDLYKDEAEAGAETEKKQEEEEEEEKPGEKKEQEQKSDPEKKDTKAATTKKKKKKAAKKKKEPSAPRTDVEKDEFGFVVGSKNHMFAQAIKEKPLTMKEVRELPWNTSKTTHYDAYNKMKRNGQAARHDDGRMYIKS